MTLRSIVTRITQWEDLNFLVTNRLPRRWATYFIGWLSRREHPLVRGACIAVWRFFTGADLSDAKSTAFKSLHDCFVRELKEGARRVDPHPGVIVGPCDGIVGAVGPVVAGQALQIKGFPYALLDLLGEAALVQNYQRGSYVTLRLSSGMYHRFHAPHDCRVEQVTYVSGDTWNVNPIALKRIEKLFCKNERAIIRCRLLGTGDLVTLVPVAAILVASIRLHFLDVLLSLKYRGANTLPCNAVLRKGEEMGWFEHGSTIIAFAPEGVALSSHLQQGQIVRMGEPLFTLPSVNSPSTPDQNPDGSTP
jgi:phosphatidylserine decarboxylase